MTRRGATKKQPTAREYRMAALYRGGQTLKCIGDQYGISRERVRQLLKKHFGYHRYVRDPDKETAERKAQRRAEADSSFLSRWGCTRQEYTAIRDFAGKGVQDSRRPTTAYNMHKQHARYRGVAWQLTLAEWWSIWQESGKWQERGPGSGYCMCRVGDEGPYAVGNVFIATGCENSSQQKRKKSGLPLGVAHGKNGRYRATRCIGGKIYSLGVHDTPEQAHAAYLAAEEIAA